MGLELPPFCPPEFSPMKAYVLDLFPGAEEAYGVCVAWGVVFDVVAHLFVSCVDLTVTVLRDNLCSTVAGLMFLTPETVKFGDTGVPGSCMGMVWGVVRKWHEANSPVAAAPATPPATRHASESSEYSFVDCCAWVFDCCLIL